MQRALLFCRVDARIDPRADASIRPYNSTVTIHHFTLDNPSIPVYNKYNSKMYKGVTVL